MYICSAAELSRCYTMETVVGFGSLLSELSARSTFGGHLSNFRYAKVYGFRRIFSHTYPMFYETGNGEDFSSHLQGLPYLDTICLTRIANLASC